MKINAKSKWVSVILALALVLVLLPFGETGADEPEVEENFGFIPNHGEASVSKVELVSGTAIARYWTAPRADDTVDAFGEPQGDEFGIDPFAWRTNRIAVDLSGNAWAINTGVNGTNLQGSVARIQLDTSGIGAANTSEGHDDILDFGQDEAVQVFAVGEPGDIPRTINFDADGYAWIGFHMQNQKYGYYQKYEYNGTDLVAIGDPVGGMVEGEELPEYDIAPYNAQIDKSGVLWFASYGSSALNRNTGGDYAADNGIYSFDTKSADPGSTLQKYSGITRGYGILIDNGDIQDLADPVIVYATDQEVSGRFYKLDTTGGNTVFSSVSHSGVNGGRGLTFDDDGNVWIASYNAGRVALYMPETGHVASWRGFGNQGSGGRDDGIVNPVGIGKDASGKLWVVMRNDGSPTGYLRGFDPAVLIEENLAGLPGDPPDVTDIEVGDRPYAYADFVADIPEEPETYGFCGYKYLGETYKGLEGWTINLEVWVDDNWEAYIDKDGNAVTATTDENGKYCFTDLPAGTYRVSEVLKPGYEQIYPADNEHIVVLPGGETPESTILYGTQRNNPNNNGLYEIDLDAGTSTRLFNAGGSGNSPNGLGFDPVNKRLYYMKVSEPNGPSDLFFYDLETGIETAAGLSLPGEVVVGASFFEGAYYYIPNLTADLHKVTLNPNGTKDQDIKLWENFNGDNSAVYRFGDFAINRQGMLYASTNDTGGSTAEFFKLDVATGEYTLIADKGNPNAALLLQVSFGSDGTLYGHSAGSGEFFTIDLEEGTKSSIGYVSSDKREQELFSDLASGIQPYDFRNVPAMVKACETAWGYNEDTYEPNNQVEGNPSNAWGWTNLIDLDGYDEEVVLDLYAGAAQNDLDKGAWVGTVTIEYDDGKEELTVTYEIGEGLDCWFSEMHLWVGETELPTWEQSRGRSTVTIASAAPGQFNYKDIGDNPFVVDVSELDEVWVAAHAVVCCWEYHPDYDGPQ